MLASAPAWLGSVNGKFRGLAGVDDVGTGGSRGAEGGMGWGGTRSLGGG